MIVKNNMMRLTLILFALFSLALFGCGSSSDNPAPQPSVKVLPADYDFGIVTNGNTVAALEVTIQNDGGANLSLSGIAITGTDMDNFTVDPNTGTSPCGAAGTTLPPGGQCNVTVEFTPQGFGTFNSDLTIQSNDPTASAYDMNLLGSKEDITAVNVKINQIEAVCPRGTGSAVTAYVSVTDQGGFPVTTLDKDDFTITEAGVLKTTDTSSFVNETVTLSVSLLMDYSYSITKEPDNVSDMQNAAISFVNQMGDQDEAEIIKYATLVDVTQPFTEDQDLLKDKIATTPNLGGGETALYDALAQAIDDISASTKDRRAIIIITDGKDDDGTGNPLSNATLNDVIAGANAQGVPVFTVGLGSADATILQQLAADTGGTYSDSTTSDNLETIYQQLADLLFTDQYILTYNTGLDSGDSGDLEIEAAYDTGITGTDTKTILACP